MPGADRRGARTSGIRHISPCERTMPINVWDYLREYDELRDEILAAVDRVFRSGRLILGQEGIKFEREMAGLSRRRRRRRREQRNRRDLHRAGVAGRQGRRRGHHRAQYGGADGLGDPHARCYAGIRRHPRRRFPDGCRPGRGGDHAAHQGDRSGASVRPVRRSRSADGDCRAARAEGDGGLCAVAGRALQESPVRQRRSCLGVLVLSDQGAGRLWRRRHGDEQRRGGRSGWRAVFASTAWKRSIIPSAMATIRVSTRCRRRSCR